MLFPVQAFGIHVEKAQPTMTTTIRQLEAASTTEMVRAAIGEMCDGLLSSGAAGEDTNLEALANAVYLLMKPAGTPGALKKPRFDGIVSASKKKAKQGRQSTLQEWCGPSQSTGSSISQADSEPTKNVYEPASETPTFSDGMWEGDAQPRWDLMSQDDGNAGPPLRSTAEAVAEADTQPGEVIPTKETEATQLLGDETTDLDRILFSGEGAKPRHQRPLPAGPWAAGPISGAAASRQPLQKPNGGAVAGEDIRTGGRKDGHQEQTPPWSKKEATEVQQGTSGGEYPPRTELQQSSVAAAGATGRASNECAGWQPHWQQAPPAAVAPPRATAWIQETIAANQVTGLDQYGHAESWSFRPISHTSQQGQNTGVSADWPRAGATQAMPQATASGEAVWLGTRQLRLNPYDATLADTNAFWRVLLEAGVIQHTREGDGFDWQWQPKMDKNSGLVREATARTLDGGVVNFWMSTKPAENGKITIGGPEAAQTWIARAINEACPKYSGPPSKQQKRKMRQQGCGPYGVGGSC
jgi:hypothetical protein